GDGADDGRAVEAELFRPGLFQRRLQLGWIGGIGAEQHVAARDHRAHVVEAQLLEDAAQFLVALVGVARGDAPQQGDVLGYGYEPPPRSARCASRKSFPSASSRAPNHACARRLLSSSIASPTCRPASVSATGWSVAYRAYTSS